MRLSFNEEVEDLPIVLPVLSYLSLLVFTIGKVLGLSPTFVLSPTMRKIIAAYERPTSWCLHRAARILVIYTPAMKFFIGGTYGSVTFPQAAIPVRHLGRTIPEPPSQSDPQNPVPQVCTYRGQGRVLRTDNVRDSLRPGRAKSRRVTDNSAIQVSLTAYPRDRYFVGDRATLAHKFLVAVSLNNYSYPGSADSEALRQNYNKAMTELLTYLAEQTGLSLSIPAAALWQGSMNDAPFLREMGWPPSCAESVGRSSIRRQTRIPQRRLFAMCDLHLASRYHPAIFGNTGPVPGLCIYYEHKALGFMQQLGLERFAVDIRKLDIAQMRALIDELLQKQRGNRPASGVQRPTTASARQTNDRSGG